MLFDKDGICEILQKIITEGQCCVCDPDERNDRCCAFSRTFRSSPSFFCFGHVNDSEHMSDKKFQATKIAVTFKTLLGVFAVIFGIVGLFCIVVPEHVVFNVIVVDEFKQQLGVQEDRLMPIEEQAHKETVVSMLKSSMSGLSSLFENTNDISKEDLIKIRDQLDQVQNHLIYNKPETVSITEPTSLMGGAMIFYASLCLYQLSLSTAQLIDLKCVYMHWLWFGCGIIAIIAATSGHGRNLENSSFVICLIVFYILGMVSFGIIERMIHGFFQKHGQIAKYNFSEDEIDDDNN